MVIIGINYAVEPFGLALVQDGQCLKSVMFKSTYQSTETMGEQVVSLLAEFGLALNDISGIGVCTGPGQYTSLRVSVSIVKTMAQFLNCPVVPIQTMRALALPFKSFDQLFCTIIPARKGEFNMQLFGNCNGELQEYSSCVTCTYKDLDAMLSKFEKTIHVVGVIPEEYDLCDNKEFVIWTKCRIDPVIIAEETSRILKKELGKTYRDFSVYYSHQPV